MNEEFPFKIGVRAIASAPARPVTERLFRGCSVLRVLRKVPGFSEQLLYLFVGCLAEDLIRLANGVEWFWPRDHNQLIHRLIHFIARFNRRYWYGNDNSRRLLLLQRGDRGEHG